MRGCMASLGTFNCGFATKVFVDGTCVSSAFHPCCHRHHPNKAATKMTEMANTTMSWMRNLRFELLESAKSGSGLAWIVASAKVVVPDLCGQQKFALASRPVTD